MTKAMKLFNRESINDIINDWADIPTSVALAGPLNENDVIK